MRWRLAGAILVICPWSLTVIPVLGRLAAGEGEWFTLLFLPPGAIGAAILAATALLATPRTFRLVLAGYLISLPVAIVGVLLSGLVVSPGWLATTIYGSPPQVFGMAVASRFRSR
jgi:hypothetical protein